MKDRVFVRPDWLDIEDYCQCIRRGMMRDNYQPDAIIGLLRGGVIPARIIADYFGIVLDFFALDVKLYEKVGIRKEEPVIRYDFKESDLKGKILIVDDIYDSGKTMRAVLDHFKGKDIKTATLHWKETASESPDYYARVATEKEWIVYPWEVNEFEREMNEKPM